MAAARVIVVGAGLAGAACARALHDAGMSVRVVERGRAPGGRLASPELHGRRVDLGAAYFTVRDDGFRALVEQWRAAGLAREWTDTFSVAGPTGIERTTTGPMRWAAPDGLRRLARERLEGVAVELGTTVWEVGRIDGRPAVAGEPADVVVLAMPDPQAARLLHEPARTEDVGYDPVIAVAAGWRERDWPFAAAAFVHDHPDVSLVADDGARRGDGAAVLVVHTTPERAARHLDQPDGSIESVLAALRDVIGVTTRPEWTHAHRWTFAQPAATHDRTHELDTAGIGRCSDAWCPQGSPRVESAWRSGTDLAAGIIDRLA